MSECEYSRSNRENLALPVQMQSSKKLKIFCFNFIAFLESKLNLQHLKKKNKPHSLSISEISDSERHGYLNA